MCKICRCRYLKVSKWYRPKPLFILLVFLFLKCFSVFHRHVCVFEWQDTNHFVMLKVEKWLCYWVKSKGERGKKGKTGRMISNHTLICPYTLLSYVCWTKPIDEEIKGSIFRRISHIGTRGIQSTDGMLQENITNDGLRKVLTIKGQSDEFPPKTILHCWSTL